MTGYPFDWAVNAFIKFCGEFFDSMMAFVFSFLPSNETFADWISIDTEKLDYATQKIADTISYFNIVFPFDTLFLIMSFMLVFETVLLFFKITIFIIGLLRGGH